jgi:hypothetical protein
MQRRNAHVRHSLVTIAAFAISTSACAHHERMQLEPDHPAHRDAVVPLLNDTGPPIVFADSKRVLVKNGQFGGWQVPLADALRADAGAGDFVRAQHPEIFAKLSRYVAQIFGVTDDDGHKLVEMSFMCNVSLAPVADDTASSPAPTEVEEAVLRSMLDGPRACNDGGDCCFRLYFDPTSGSYTAMQMNGR